GGRQREPAGGDRLKVQTKGLNHGGMENTEKTDTHIFTRGDAEKGESSRCLSKNMPDPSFRAATITRTVITLSPQVFLPLLSTSVVRLDSAFLRALRVSVVIDLRRSFYDYNAFA